MHRHNAARFRCLLLCLLPFGAEVASDANSFLFVGHQLYTSPRIQLLLRQPNNFSILAEVPPHELPEPRRRAVPGLLLVQGLQELPRLPEAGVLVGMQSLLVEPRALAPGWRDLG